MPRTEKPVPFWANYLKYLQFHRRQVIGAGIGILVLLVLAFPLRVLVVPAIVNGQPIFSWTYLVALHRAAGSQVLQQLVNEKLIEQEIRRQGVQITPAELDQQIRNLEDDLKASGGLDKALSAQGISREEFTRQLKLNLAMEKVVKGTIEVTDADITKELAANPRSYQSLSEVDAATTAAQNLRTARLQEAFTSWFEQLRSQANIRNFFK